MRDKDAHVSKKGRLVVSRCPVDPCHCTRTHTQTHTERIHLSPLMSRNLTMQLFHRRGRSLTLTVKSYITVTPDSTTHTTVQCVCPVLCRRQLLLEAVRLELNLGRCFKRHETNVKPSSGGRLKKAPKKKKKLGQDEAPCQESSQIKYLTKQNNLHVERIRLC